jgi:hypothetical protein
LHLVNTTDPTPHIPRLQIDTGAISDRLNTLATIPPCPDCGPAVVTAATECAAVLGELIRLYAVLIEARRESANRLAAIRAAVGAERDGEADPLAYVRDELADSPDRYILSGQSRGWWR